MNKKIGFTLAEVLITLAIIGIIAAITIPSLTYQSKKQQWVSALAKSYKSLNDAFALSQAQNGSLTDWEWSQGITYIMETNILPYFRVHKNCGTKNRDCFTNSTYTHLNGTSGSNPNTLGANHYQIQTSDGMLWDFAIMNAECVKNKTRCMTIMVDINGKAKPNTYGRDTFVFQVFPFTDQVIPNGLYTSSSFSDDSWGIVDDNSINLNCSSSGKGAHCSARIIRDGWQMNY